MKKIYTCERWYELVWKRNRSQYWYTHTGTPMKLEGDPLTLRICSKVRSGIHLI